MLKIQLELLVILKLTFPPNLLRLLLSWKMHKVSFLINHDYFYSIGFDWKERIAKIHETIEVIDIMVSKE